MTTMLQNAELVRSKLLQAAGELRSFCSSVNFQGDRLACANGADQAEQFVRTAEQPGRLLARARAGDEDAARRFVEGGSTILEAVTGIPFEMRDATLSDLGNRIADEVKENAGVVGAGIGAGIAIPALIGAGLFLFTR